MDFEDWPRWKQKRYANRYWCYMARVKNFRIPKWRIHSEEDLARRKNYIEHNKKIK